MKIRFLATVAALLINSGANAQTNVDVMVLFDKQSVEWLNSNNRSSLDFAIDTINRAEIPYRNSGINLRFNVVYQGCIDHSTEAGTDGSNMGVDLEHISSDTEIAELRQQYGADIVHLIVNIKRPQYGSWVAGVGYSPVRTGNGTVFISPGVGFSVASIQDVNQSDISRTTAHEIGHNFGAGHAFEQDKGLEERVYDHAYGNYFGSSLEYYSVMAYRLSFDQSGAPIFSSAFGTYKGIRTGDDKKDNTRVITDNLSTIAGFKSTANKPLPQANCADPTTSPPIPSSEFFSDGFE